jgi:hypothetical protein
MHSYRLEGEAYLLAGLFLPLLAGEIVLLFRTGLVRHGAVAGLYLSALAWSSGYYGVDGGILGLVLVPVLAWTSGKRWSQLGELWKAGAALVGVALPFLILLGWVLTSGELDTALSDRFPQGEDPLSNVAQDSVSLSGLLVPFPAVAHLRQFRIFYLGLAPLILGLAALSASSWRDTLPWSSLAMVGLLLALGPTLRLTDADPGQLSMPYAWIHQWIPGILAYRMPARFLALVFLGLGGLVALLLSQLRRDGLTLGFRGLLVSLVVVDGLVFTGAALDETLTPAEVPRGYEALSGEGAVLDFHGFDRDLLRYSGRSAYYQVFHGMPVLCDFTQTGDAQAVISRILGIALVEGRDEESREVFSVLWALGVRDLAFHSRTFRDGDGEVIRKRLMRLARSERAIPDTGSDPVEIFHIPTDKEGLSLTEARRRLQAWKEES